MTTDEVLRMAAARGLRFELDDDRVRIDGDLTVIDDLMPLLSRHADDIYAILREHTIGSNADPLLRAACLLRYGLWVPTSPLECAFHIGAPGSDCRRCGGPFLGHYEKVSGRIQRVLKETRK